MTRDETQDQLAHSDYICPDCRDGRHERCVYADCQCDQHDQPINYINCQFCGAWHEPVKTRVPSQTCARCWLDIAAGLLRKKA